MDLDDVAKIGAVAGAMLGLGTFLKAIFEYTRSNAMKRADYFFGMRRTMYGNKKVVDIMMLLETGDQKLREVAYRDKMEFLGFYEEVAISNNSRLLNDRIAHYMFGYYAIRCWDSPYFWEEGQINKESMYWSLFRSFAEKMKTIEDRDRFSTSKLKF